MPSKKPYNSLEQIPEFNSEKEKFLTLNQQSLAELLTFIDFADDKLTIGFVEINFAKDRDALIKILQNHRQCQDIQFKILNFSKELRFLRDAIVEELAGIKIEDNKKLVVILIGLEKSIGMSGEYPPVLQDLNFVRDAFTTSVPHPILLFLPNYALTRLAKYAPDFWAWRAGVFHFQTDENTKNYAIEQTLDSEKIRESFELAERQERIDLLQRLLMEYSPDNNHQASTNIRGCINILEELGIVYRSIGEVKKAEDSLRKALYLVDEKQELAQEKSSILHNLGYLYDDLGKIDEAIALYKQSLEITERIGNLQGKAATLHCLAIIYANRGDVDEAIALYKQSLEIFERIGDVQGKAATLHCLAIIYANRGDVDEAIALYKQSLEIKERIGNLQGKAATLHCLAIIYANRGDVDEAIALFQKSLEINERIGNVHGKAMTLWSLGYLAQEQGDFVTAINYLQPSLEILQRLKSPDAEKVSKIIAKVQEKVKSKTVE
ncbi:tetratricopeptide repeat protein [Tolypothrix sp. VBCCA 56010]|uniref:tetratricopeptide repeat protein n=1 Tax=Tolypothrix sp. VBCCA 56010 TaxID=3137731 RepID=UPI003D7DF043